MSMEHSQINEHERSTESIVGMLERSLNNENWTEIIDNKGMDAASKKMENVLSSFDYNENRTVYVSDNGSVREATLFQYTQGGFVGTVVISKPCERLGSSNGSVDVEKYGGQVVNTEDLETWEPGERAYQ